jgi:hypothetical protein
MMTPPAQKKPAPLAQVRPATDSQLARLGRLLGLGYDEAEALLEALAEAPPPAPGPAPARHRALRQLSGRFPPPVLEALQAVPGVFLLTDGVTPGRLGRARARVDAALSVSGRLELLLAWAEQAAEREAQLLLRAAQALAAAQKGEGPLGERARGALRSSTAAIRPPRRSEATVAQVAQVARGRAPRRRRVH